MDYKDKFNILVQGPLNDISLEALDYYSTLGNVVLSYWDDAAIPENFKRKAWKEVETECPNIEALVKSGKLPKYWKDTTFYYALNSIYRGLQHCDKPFTVKIRSDERYSNLSPLMDNILENPEKVFCGNIFHKNGYPGGFHMGDHLVTCNTEDLKAACELSRKMYEPGSAWNCAEVVLAKSLLITKNQPVTIEAYDDTIKAIDINTLGDYTAQWQHANITYNSVQGVGNIFNHPDCNVH